MTTDSARVNVIIGTVFDAMGKGSEARPYYETALKQSLTVQPDFQSGLGPFLKRRLATPDNFAQGAPP